MGELLHISSSKRTISMGGRAWNLVYPGVYKKMERNAPSAPKPKPRTMVTTFTQTPTELTNFERPVKKPEEKPAEKEEKDKDWEPDWWMLPHPCHSIDFHYQFREHGPCSPGGTMPLWKTHTRPKDPEPEPPAQRPRSQSVVSACSICGGQDSDEDDYEIVAISRSPSRRRSVHFEDERSPHRSTMRRPSREVQVDINTLQSQTIQHLENHAQQHRRKTLLLVDEKIPQSVEMSHQHKSVFHRDDPETHRNDRHHQQHSGFCCERHGGEQALSRPRSSFKGSNPCVNTIKSLRFPVEVEADNGRRQTRDVSGPLYITPFNPCGSLAQQFPNLPTPKIVILNCQDFSYHLTIVHTLDSYPYPWPDWPLFIFSEKLGFEKATMTNSGSIAGPGTTRAILPTAAHVLIVEHMLEVPSDPRPNAFFDSRTGILRVYHGNIYGNPTGSLLPVSAQNVQSSQLGSSGSPGNPMAQAAAGAQGGFGGSNDFAGAGAAPMTAQLPAMMGGLNLNPQMMLLPKVMPNAMYGANAMGVGVEVPQPPPGMKFVAVPIDAPYMLNVRKPNHNNSGSRSNSGNGNYKNGRNSSNGKNEGNNNGPGNNSGGSRNNSNWNSNNNDDNNRNDQTLGGSNDNKGNRNDNNNGCWNSSNNQNNSNQNNSGGNSWANPPTNNNNNKNSEGWSDPNSTNNSGNDGGGNTWTNGTSNTPAPTVIHTSPIPDIPTVVVDTFEMFKEASPKQDAPGPSWKGTVEAASEWDAPPETPGDTASFEGWEAATVVNNDADEIAAKIPGAFSDNGNSSNYNRNNGSGNYDSNGDNNNNGGEWNVNSPRQNNNNNSGNQNGGRANANVTSPRQNNSNPNNNNNRNRSGGNHNNNGNSGNNNNHNTSGGWNNGNNNGNGGWVNANVNSPSQNNSENNNNNQACGWEDVPNNQTSSGWEDIPADNNNNSNNRNNNSNNNNGRWCQVPNGSPIVNQGDDISRPMDSCITAGSWANGNNNNNNNNGGNQHQKWGDKTAAQSTRRMDTGW